MASNLAPSSLGKLLTFGNGKTSPPRSERGNHPVYGSNGVIGYANEANADANTIIIGRVGSYCGSLYFSKQKCWVTDNAIRATAREANDPRFAYYLLSTLNLNNMRAGSGQPLLNQGILSGIDVLVPIPGVQRAISAMLGSLDDKIELNGRMKETLQQTARALFKSWFVDFDPVSAKASGRDPGLPRQLAGIFPNTFVDSELGKIPTGWRVAKLGSLLSVVETGGRPKGGVKDITEGVPSVGAESIVGLGDFDYSKTRFVPRDFFESMNRGHVRDYDVLLYKDGGRPGVYEPHLTMVGDGFPFAELCINEHVYRLRTEPTVPQSYLFFWLTSDSAMEEMRTRGTGVAIPGLNSTAVESWRCYCPRRP
jgi:type I restriction enzyme S subunit